MADHDPEVLDELLQRGTKLYAVGRTTAAVAIYRDALTLAPDNPTVRYRHATALWHGEHHAEEALAEITAIAEQYPGNAALHHTATQINNSLGRRADAATAARTTLAADSGHTSAWHELVLAHGPEESSDLRGELERRSRPG